MTRDDFGTERVSRILLHLAPPVMLAQLIQALYNIVDSFFVGRYSDAGLTALSIIYPLQLLMIALAAGTAAPLGLALWALFAVVCFLILPGYARMSTDSEEVVREVIVYGRIVCVGSVGLFTESVWTKVLQAEGDMKTPMLAQILGAVTNIVLDPILIFGLFGVPVLGIAGAAIATVAGQIAAALLVMRRGFRPSPALRRYPALAGRIYRLGIPNILMQSAYTFYILGLNLILATFSDQAVTALGLYYKWQTFFFIPLGALQTCMVPIVSFNYAAQRLDRCRETLKVSLLWGLALMFLGLLCFEFLPGPMLRLFSRDALVISIGSYGFRWIGLSFLPQVTSLIFPVFFQAVGYAGKSSLLTILRTVVLFVPLGWALSLLGLHAFWLTYPITEVVTSLVGFGFYRQSSAGRAPCPQGESEKTRKPAASAFFDVRYLGRRTISGVISEREWAPHMAMVSVSSARSLST